MESRKKVLFLITKSEPFGGAQWYVYDLATSLPKERFEVAVAAGGAGLLFEKLQAAGLRTISVPSLQRNINPFADTLAFFQILSIIRNERPDVLHLNSSKVGAMGGLIGRLSGVRRVIFTAHGWEFNAPRPFLQQKVIKLLSRLAVVFAHKTIAVSEAMRAAFPNARRMCVIHNGIEQVIAPPRDEARRLLSERSVPIDGAVLGTIAELHPVKGLLYAIEAVALLRDRGVNISFVVFGEGAERTKLEKLIRERRLESAVHLLGFEPVIQKYLSGFDIFTQPSLSEGLGFALLAAGSIGLPVVASRVGGIPEVVEHEKSGLLVPPCDYTALAEAIQSLLSDPKKSAAYGAALKERVLTKFSHTAMIEKTIALYA